MSGQAPAFAPAMGRSEALRQLVWTFVAADLPEPTADARILLEEATGLRRAGALVSGEGPIGEDAARVLGAWTARRLAREPVFRIVGQREFWGLALRVTPAVLDPRPDTETVVTAAMRALSTRRREPLRVLDLGTGSGALLGALLTEWPAATGIGVDRSAPACAVAAENLAACGLAGRFAVVEGDWTESLAGRFDCIVCNPPYIPTADIAALDPEVRDHDPHPALDGGPDGLSAYRAICPRLPGLLAEGGAAVFEVGAGQAAAVAALMEEAGLRWRETMRDLGGHERAVVAGL